MLTGTHNRAALIAVALAAAAAVAATALPMCAEYAMDMAAGAGSAATAATTEFRRVPCDMSPSQLLIAWLPVAIGMVVIALRATAAAGIARFVAAAMLLGFVIVAGFSIGLLYAPAAAAMIVAATAGQTAERRGASVPATE